jgi:ethanolamine ammonia-lyase small subunit
MSAYIAYQSSPDKPESQRTVVSNIHNGGLYPVEAGAQILNIVEVMLKEKKSGVDLKMM